MSSYLDLDDNLLLEILKNLSCRDVNTVRETNRQFRQVCQDIKNDINTIVPDIDGLIGTAEDFTSSDNIHRELHLKIYLTLNNNINILNYEQSNVHNVISIAGFYILIEINFRSVTIYFRAITKLNPTESSSIWTSDTMDNIKNQDRYKYTVLDFSRSSINGKNIYYRTDPVKLKRRLIDIILLTKYLTNHKELDPVIKILISRNFDYNCINSLNNLFPNADIFEKTTINRLNDDIIFKQVKTQTDYKILHILDTQLSSIDNLIPQFSKLKHDSQDIEDVFEIYDKHFDIQLNIIEPKTRSIIFEWFSNHFNNGRSIPKGINKGDLFTINIIKDENTNLGQLIINAKGKDTKTKKVTYGKIDTIANINYVLVILLLSLNDSSEGNTITNIIQYTNNDTNNNDIMTIFAEKLYYYIDRERWKTMRHITNPFYLVLEPVKTGGKRLFL